MIDAKLSRREAVVGAIIDLHLRRLLESFPSHKSARAQVETYRPYAEQEADAVLAALDNLKSE